MKRLAPFALFLICFSLSVPALYAQDTVVYVPDKTFVSFTNGETNYLAVYTIDKGSKPLGFTKKLPLASGKAMLYLPGGEKKEVALDETVTLGEQSFTLAGNFAGAACHNLLMMRRPHPDVESIQFTMPSFIGNVNEAEFMEIATGESYEAVRQLLAEHTEPVNLNTSATLRENLPEIHTRQSYLWSKFLVDGHILTRMEADGFNLALMASKDSGKSSVVRLPSNDLLIIDTGADEDFIHIRNEVNQNIIDIIKTRQKEYDAIRIHVLITNLTPGRSANLSKFLETEVYTPNWGYFFVNLLSLNEERVTETRTLLEQTHSFQPVALESAAEKDALAIYAGPQFQAAADLEKVQGYQTEGWGFTGYRFLLEPTVDLQFMLSNEVTLDGDTAMLTGVIHNGYKTLFLSNAGQLMLERLKGFIDQHTRAWEDTIEEYIEEMDQLRRLFNYRTEQNRDESNQIAQDLQLTLNKRLALQKLSMKTDNLVWAGNASFTKGFGEVMNTLISPTYMDPTQVLVQIGENSSRRDNLYHIKTLVFEQNRQRLRQNDYYDAYQKILQFDATLQFGWVSRPYIDTEEENTNSERPTVIEATEKKDIRYYS
jgi:hypothetical protein